VLGARRDRRVWVDAGGRALTAAAVLLAGAVGALSWALLTGDYSLEYVARATTRSMSWPYRLGSLWSGMEGSLLLWSCLLAFAAALGVRRLRRTEELGPSPDGSPAAGGLRAGAQAVLGALTAGAALLVLTVADPFTRLAFPALDGARLTPILEHPALLYHPPILYLGQTALAVPFGVTIAALARGRLDGAWLAVTRRFALVAWVALSFGMVGGAHWAYQELGWGGFWAWDPVENASLLPWLATTAFLHAALVVERRGRLRAWTAALAMSAFAFSLVGAYLTRSGVTGSVHAFAEARAIGVGFLAAVAGVVVGGGVLLARRWRGLGEGWAPDGPGSREAALLANNALLLTGLLVVAAGTLTPLVSQALGQSQFSVSPTFFASLTAVPALLALALAGIAPALPWASVRRSLTGAPSPGAQRRLVVAGSGAGAGILATVGLGLMSPLMLLAAVAGGSTVALSATQAVRVRRRRRPLGASLAHLGLALALLGIIGSTRGAEITGPLRPGERLTLGRYRLVQEGLIERAGDRRTSERVQLGVFVGGHRVGTLRPGLDTFYGSTGAAGAPLPETAMRSTLREDLLVTVVRIDIDRDVAVLEVFRRPLVAWVWVGGLLLTLGGALALWGSSARRPLAVPPALVPAEPAQRP
ncbi:MAG TPA: cytochrome c-type biogenesis CcmF C-terminal domain-containing protein, partial [Acidimicrobiia bacterium]|nr:cytochrome c-type biogenesis CcmF C-terminal domain-containing protein [Acidimicrobiia bacterium]